MPKPDVSAPQVSQELAADVILHGVGRLLREDTSSRELNGELNAASCLANNQDIWYKVPQV